jgi:ubiquinone biosynthesis monooxygenase Coq7
MHRKHTPLDQLIINFDQALRTVFGQPITTERTDPAAEYINAELNDAERQHAARLMRVNHAGEVAAQALYQGQALTAHSDTVRNNMRRSALEENDHLRWCEDRVKALESHVSVFNPLWYAGSFTIGSIAGLAGDKWSLGFVAETERQVVAHIDEHLAQISEHDEKSRAVLRQMRVDEAHHATVAIKHGGVPLPKPIPWLMQRLAKVMTRTAYWI